MAEERYTAPAFQLYAGDQLQELLPILADSEAIGAYYKAMLYLWSNGPTEAKRLGLVAGSGWDRCGFLFDDDDGLLSLGWMEEYRAEKLAFVKKQRKNGKKGGRPKANGSKGNSDVEGENPSLSSGLTQIKPNTNPNKRLSEDEDEVEDEVEVEEENAVEEEARRKKPRAKKKLEPVELEWPSWAGPRTKAAWEEFKEYRRTEHKAGYKSPKTEQRALNILFGYFHSGPEFVGALEHSMGRGWRFPVDPAEHKYQQPSSGGEATPAMTIDDPLFVEFMGIYPKNVAQEDARYQWQHLTDHEKQDAVNGARFQVQNNQFNTDEQYIPTPANWLKGKRWKDQPTVAIDPAEARARELQAAYDRWAARQANLRPDFG